MDATGQLTPGDKNFGLPGYRQPDTESVGLLNNATVNPPPAAQATVEKATAVNYTPNAFQITPDQTVQDQIAKITSSDSKLMQQARTRANQDAQAKGLFNSSLAVEAGQNAVLSQALPIAQQDAATYNQAATNTTNAQNAAAFQNAQAQNAVNLQNSQSANAVNMQNAAETNKLFSTKLSLDSQMAMAQLDASTKTALAQLDNQYRGLLQTSQNAASKFNQITQNIASITMNNTLSKKAKDAAIASQLNMLNESLLVDQNLQDSGSAAVNDLNLGQYFQTTTPQGTQPLLPRTPTQAAPLPQSVRAPITTPVAATPPNKRVVGTRVGPDGRSVYELLADGTLGNRIG